MNKGRLNRRAVRKVRKEDSSDADPRAESYIKMYLLDVKICRLAPLRVLKSKMTAVRIIVVYFKVLSRTEMAEYDMLF